MSSPTPPASRGRGRGRGKELTPNERVTQWVNQREARRLNKERWGNRTPETSSPVGDKDNGNESPVPAKQDTTDSEIGCERSKGKRQVVQLYVPPSLRNKKALSPGAAPENVTTRSGDSFPSGKDILSSVSCQSDIVSQKNEVSENTASASTKGVSEDQESRTLETVKPKGRGRGRKKPEVEIYVPRALRAAKQDSKSPAKTLKDDENKSLILDSQRRPSDPDCDNYSENLPKEPAAAKHDGNPDQMLVGDPMPSDQECYSQGVNHDISESSSSLVGDFAAKKMKHEVAEGKTFDCVSEAAHPEIIGTTDVQSGSESASDPFTFEFYDPAVIAFMPSPQIVQKTCDENNSSSYFNHSSFGSSSYESGMYTSPADVNDSFQSALCPAQSQTTADTQHQSVTYARDVTNCELNSTEKVRMRRDSDLNVQAIELDVIENEDPNSQKPSEDSLLSLTQESVEDHSCRTGISQISQEKSLREASSEEFDAELSVNNGYSNVPCEHDLPSSKGVFEGTHCGTLNCQEQSDVTSISKEISSNTKETQKLKTEENCEVRGIKQSDEQSTESTGADDEDSWDAMFDDNGDCLDESLVNELTEFVGKVEIDKPKINYLNYEPKEPELDLQAFSHIVEIYDFSPELATCDLIGAFREFSSRGFDVKWVDDTHALGVFASTVAANEALKMIHPLLKVRPMSQASKKGQSKARHCQEFLQPYKARPETTSIAARRLVAGALGMAPRVSKEVREQERKKLKEAKEKRRQERQQKIDMWDGSFGKCAMDEEEAGSR